VQAIPVFFVGIFLGMLAIKSGSILPTIIIHFVNNLLSSIISVLATKFPTYSTQIQVGTDILFVVTAVVLFLLFSHEFGIGKEEKTEHQERPNIKPFRTFFTSWSIISVIILCAIITVFGYITPVK
jgi:membrane protease YdiL (CAAX protease family)